MVVPILPQIASNMPLMACVFPNVCFQRKKIHLQVCSPSQRDGQVRLFRVRLVTNVGIVERGKQGNTDPTSDEVLKRRLLTSRWFRTKEASYMIELRKDMTVTLHYPSSYLLSPRFCKALRAPLAALAKTRKVFWMLTSSRNWREHKAFSLSFSLSAKTLRLLVFFSPKPRQKRSNTPSRSATHLTALIAEEIETNCWQLHPN